MNGYSEDRAGSFEGVHVPQVLTLFAILQESGVKKSDYIKRRYLDRASQFDGTLCLLREIGIVNEDNGELHLDPACQLVRVGGDQNDVAGMVVNFIVSRESSFRSEVFDYIRQFSVLNGKAVYRPSAEQRGVESGVRNFLMELGIVTFDSSESQYVLVPEYTALFAHARHHGRSVSPAEFQRSCRTREDLGLAAEQAIVLYERERVGPGLADQVKHIALRNVAAGYDIQSITVLEKNRTLPRYIEVKAVPPQTFRYYWTANEIGVAEVCASCYYLYLLPIGTHGGFDMQGLRIIADPCSAVLKSSGEWVVECDVMRCSLAPNIRLAEAMLGR
ncbi:MAG: DUF3883 domain-containing protein [Thermoguttaceae bacterium]